VKRMATLDQISPEILNKIATVIMRKLKEVGEFSLESFGGVRAVAEMLNRMDTAASEEIMAEIAQEERNLADSIRHLMFVFEDLLSIDQDGIRALLGKVDRKALLVALKATTAELKDHFGKAMSKRAAEMLHEDLAALGPARIKDVENAQQQVIAVARQLQAEGVLNLKGSSADQYVT
jgi:flagellar motor switch protein FliG